jgi:hypothetical protein
MNSFPKKASKYTILHEEFEHFFPGVIRPDPYGRRGDPLLHLPRPCVGALKPSHVFSNVPNRSTPIANVADNMMWSSNVKSIGPNRETDYDKMIVKIQYLFRQFNQRTAASDTAPILADDKLATPAHTTMANKNS